VEGFSAGLVDEDDIYKWEVMIIGPADTFLYPLLFYHGVNNGQVVFSCCDFLCSVNACLSLPPIPGAHTMPLPLSRHANATPHRDMSLCWMDC